MTSGKPRRPNPLMMLCVGTILLITAVPSLGQEKEKDKAKEKPEWATKWSNGFKVDSSDKAFRLKFGGRVQADYQFVSTDDGIDAEFGEDAFQNGFEFRRARLFVEGTIYERVKFKAQYDFTGGDADFKDLYVGLPLQPGDLVFGHVKEPFTLNDMTSSKYIAFLERATPVEVFSPGRNSGISFFGKRGDRVNYGVGFYYDANDFGTSLHEDRYNVTGRVAFRPIYEDKGRRLVHVGLSLTDKSVEEGGSLRFRGRAGTHFGPRPVDTSGIPADGAFAYVLELAGVFNRFWASGEYLQMEVDSPNQLAVPPVVGGPQLDPALDGYYVQGGYYLTDDYRRYKTAGGGFDRQKPTKPWMSGGGKGAWEIAFRYATVDLSEAATGTAELSNFTLGVNWYLNPATRLMVNYLQSELETVGDIDAVLIRWQVDF